MRIADGKPFDKNILSLAPAAISARIIKTYILSLRKYELLPFVIVDRYVRYLDLHYKLRQFGNYLEVSKGISL